MAFGSDNLCMSLTIMPRGESESESEHNNKPLTMGDEQILEQIYSTHVHSDLKFDVGSLLAIVDNTLSRSTHVVDSLLQGSQPSWEGIEERMTPDYNFVTPLCTLKKISSKLSCKGAGEETAHKTTLAILKKLSEYEWDAKAVITLGALAMEYGEFWLLAHHHPNDLLAKSVGVLKRVNGFSRFASLDQHRQAILDLNTLIKTLLQLIHLIFDLHKLTTSYHTEDVPALIPVTEQIPVDVYWCIITIAAIVTRIDSLTTTYASHDHMQDQDLSHYAHKINILLTKFRNHIKLCMHQIAEHNYIIKLRELLQTPTEVLEVFKFLIFSSDPPQPLYDGATQTSVSVEVLRKKNVFLFISTLEVTEEEMSVVRKVEECINTKEEYKLVWIPMVEEWTVAQRKKMEKVKAKMGWYVVEHSGVIAGFRFIREDWHFNKTPIVVVMDHQGMVQHNDAFHLIKVWGIKAFPFTFADQERVDWLRPIIRDIYPTILPWIEEEKYILFYGGSDKEWVQQFTKYATALANDVVLKEKKICMKLLCVEREEYKSVVSIFWSRIESLLKMEEVSEEVQKMVSYKHEPGWALLTKGSRVIVSGYGNTMLQTVIEFHKWKETVMKKGLAESFKEYHATLILLLLHSHNHNINNICSNKIEIHNVVGKLPHIINCPCCVRTMEMLLLTYKCCHTTHTHASHPSIPTPSPCSCIHHSHFH